MDKHSQRLVSAVTAVGVLTVLGVGGLGAPTASAAPAGGGAGSGIVVPAGFTVQTLAAGGGAMVGPDDITQLGDKLFIGYQNGVGAKGEPAPSGQTASTIVEYTLQGSELARWNLPGKVDGLTADPSTHRVLATVNEDANSSLYGITPATNNDRGQVVHYQYSPNPLPHGGGTDSISVRNGQVYVVGSAPAANPDGTTYSGSALYKVTLDVTTAHTTPAFPDNATATDAVTGKPVTLNLSDPDSSGFVPASSSRFGGDLLLDSQGDAQLAFLAHPGVDSAATVLNLNTQVDDTAFATSTHGTLYVVDGATNTVVAVRGPFQTGQAFTSVPKDSTTLPGTLGQLNLSTGQVTPFGTGFGSPKGLLFVPDNPPTTARADLQVRVETPLFAGAGANVTTTVTVTNNGPATAAPAPTTLIVPAGYTVTTNGGGSLATGSVGGFNTFTTPTLKQGEKATFTTTLTAPKGFAVGLTAAYTFSTTPDPNLFNNIGLALTFSR